MSELLIYSIVGVALAFDFVNGFHDAANAIATIVATRVLTPIKAVTMSAIGNFMGMFVGFLTGAHIAKTIGTGIINVGADPSAISPHLILAILIGAIGWDLITWYFGLPTSSSHALVGGVVGAGVAAMGMGIVLGPDMKALMEFLVFTGLGGIVGGVIWAVIHRAIKAEVKTGTLLLGAVIGMVAMGSLMGWVLRKELLGLTVTIAFMVFSPLIGMGVAFLIVAAVVRKLRKYHQARINRHFRNLQLVSSFFYSVMHGTSDAQKVMGIITMLLFTSGMISVFEVPLWVIFACHASISLGTFFGGWRIVRTMSQRITYLRPYQGFCAETGGGLVLLMNAIFGIPVSTTNVISSSIMGVGAVNRLSAVRWGVARRVIWAWILTIPMSALIAALAYLVMLPFI